MSTQTTVTTHTNATAATTTTSPLHMYTRIVVPLDGSMRAEQALTHAATLARALDIPLHLIQVVDSGPIGPFGTFSLPEDYAPFARVLNEEKEVAMRYLSTIARGLREEGHHVTTDVHMGPIAQVLLDLAHPHDLYVMASHGRGGLSRWFMGSVAEEVTRRATVPILLIRVSDNESRTYAQAQAQAQVQVEAEPDDAAEEDVTEC